MPKIKVCAEKVLGNKLCPFHIYLLRDVLIPCSKCLPAFKLNSRVLHFSVSFLCFVPSPSLSLKPPHSDFCGYIGTCQVICSDLLHQKSSTLINSAKSLLHNKVAYSQMTGIKSWTHFKPLLC